MKFEKFRNFIPRKQKVERLMCEVEFWEVFKEKSEGFFECS